MFVKMLKKLLYIFLLTFICFSCSFQIDKIERNNGTLSISVPEKRNIIGLPRDAINNDSSIKFHLTVSCIKSGYVYEGDFTDGDMIVLNNINNGDYYIKLFGTDGFSDYTAEKYQKIDFKDDKPINIDLDIKCEVLNGQIGLSFGDISLDDSSPFSITVYDNKKNAIFSKKDISPSSIINKEYIIPAYFKTGEYTVEISGGNVSSELYSVSDNGNPLTIEVGKKKTYPVISTAYLSYYVKQGSTLANPSGTITSPFKTIEEALSKNDKVMSIIIDGNYDLTESLNLSGDRTIILSGINNGKLTSDKTIIINNGVDLILQNIELSSSSNEYILLQSGKLSIKENLKSNSINIKDSFLQNGNVIKLYDSICPTSSNVLLTLETYSDNKKIFDIMNPLTFDSSKIKFSQNSYYLNSKGNCVHKYIRIIPPVGYSNMSVDVIKDGKSINNSSVSSSGLVIKNDELIVGTNITIKLTGVKDFVPYAWEKSIIINDQNQDIVFSSSDEVNASISLKLKTGNSTPEFPLTLSLTNTNKETIIKDIPSLPYTIKLSPDTYELNITSSSLFNSYTPSLSSITVAKNENKTCDVLVKPSKVYYVSSSKSSSGIGSKENPYHTVNAAITELKDSTEPITIVVLNSISDSPISISTDLNITIIGQGETKPVITSNDGFLNISSPSSNVTIRNLDINGTSLTSNSDSLIYVNNGKLLLDKDVKLNTANTHKQIAVKIGVNGNLCIKDNAYIENGIIEIGECSTKPESSKITLMNDLTPTKNFVVESNPSSLVKEGQQILFNGNIGNTLLLKNNYSKFNFTSSTLNIDENGVIQTLKVNDEIDNFIQSSDLELTLTKTFTTQDQINQLVQRLKTIPLNKKVNLDVTLSGDLKGIEGFTGLKNLKSIIIKNCASINDNAFKDCTALSSVTLPNSLLSIGKNAFSGCTSLPSLELSSSVMLIDSNAFEGVASISFPEGDSLWISDNEEKNVFKCRRTGGEENAFNFKLYGDNIRVIRIIETNDLKSILSNPNMPNFTLYINFDKLSSPLVIPSSYSKPLTIDTANSTFINDGAFSNCSSLTLNIGKNVNKLGKGILRGCIDANITIDPNNRSFKLLNNNVIASKTEDIIYQYLNKTGVTSFTIPESVSGIEPSAFLNCNLTGITVNKDQKWTTSNGGAKQFTTSNATANLSNITGLSLEESLYIVYTPKELAAVYENAIQKKLPELRLNIDATNDDIRLCDPYQIENQIKNEYYKGNLYFNFKPSKNLTIIPDNFMKIDGNYGNPNLKKVVFPNSLKKIGDDAFYSCKLEELVIQPNVFYLGDRIANPQQYLKKPKVYFEGNVKYLTADLKVLDCYVGGGPYYIGSRSIAFMNKAQINSSFDGSSTHGSLNTDGIIPIEDDFSSQTDYDNIMYVLTKLKSTNNTIYLKHSAASSNYYTFKRSYASPNFKHIHIPLNINKFEKGFFADLTSIKTSNGYGKILFQDTTKALKNDRTGKTINLNSKYVDIFEFIYGTDPSCADDSYSIVAPK